MKTSLHFEAPQDLSVGIVRISGESGAIVEWVATPDRRTFVESDMAPGLYSAEIQPAGLKPQSVVFRVQEGQANTVVLPTFSALSASGNNVSFYDSALDRATADIPDWQTLHAAEYSASSVELYEEPLNEEGVQDNLENQFAKVESLEADIARALTDGDIVSEELARFSLRAARQEIYRDQARAEASGEIESDRQLPLPPRKSVGRRRMAIGLSEEARGREAFDTFRGRSRMELVAGRIEIDLPTDPNRDLWVGHRVRLTTSIECLRTERCLLPLYRGGTRIVVTASAFASADLEFSIVPANPKTRALLRALDAGTPLEAVAVRDDVLKSTQPEKLLDDERDPWTAILFALLGIRFPDVFPPVQEDWIDSLVERAGWAFDVHVIRASHALSSAMGEAGMEQTKAVSRAISSLSQAYVAGSPYFQYSNLLVAEMMAGISSFLDPQVAPASVDEPESLSHVNKPSLSDSALNTYYRLHQRWHRELPLQRGAGPTFTWLARDLQALRERKILAPYRRPSGRLRGRDTLVIFEGLIDAGKITVNAGPAALPGQGSWDSEVNLDPDNRVSTLDPSSLPAFSRPASSQIDPNKGRFGGYASRDGFGIRAQFEKTNHRDWINLSLTVEAEHSASIALGDYAWFMLHPTFSPSAIKVTFRGNRAQLRLRVWGGFTVGVWIPSTRTELELDLAELAGAPEIIRTR